jgi:hypothetical protein
MLGRTTVTVNNDRGNNSSLNTLFYNNKNNTFVSIKKVIFLYKH